MTSADPFTPPAADSVSFRWSADGHAVAVLFGADLMGFIPDPEGPGHSRHLAIAGPYGLPMDADLFEKVFGAD